MRVDSGFIAAEHSEKEAVGGLSMGSDGVRVGCVREILGNAEGSREWRQRLLESHHGGQKREETREGLREEPEVWFARA